MAITTVWFPSVRTQPPSERSPSNVVRDEYGAHVPAGHVTVSAPLGLSPMSPEGGTLADTPKSWIVDGPGSPTTVWLLEPLIETRSVAAPALPAATSAIPAQSASKATSRA